MAFIDPRREHPGLIERLSPENPFMACATGAGRVAGAAAR